MMMKMKFCTSLLLWITFISPSCAARVLGLFYIDATSHFNFHEAMMKSLLAAGHQVTAVAPMSSTFSHENYTIINCTNRSNDSENPWAFTARQRLTSTSFFMATLNIYESSCRHIKELEQQINVRRPMIPLESKPANARNVNFTETAKNCHFGANVARKMTGYFDVMFVEVLPMFQCFLPLAEKSGIPVIGTLSVSSFTYSDLLVGNPAYPSIIPATCISSVVHTKMSFYERILNFVEGVKMKIFHFIENRVLLKLLEELYSDQDPPKYAVSLIFINNHESIRPTAQMPNSINVGGIHLKSTQLQPLPQALKIFIEEAMNGVILFSLGSIASSDTLHPQVIATLIETFAKIPQRVIWKFSGQIDGLSKNVLLMDWLPQKEILAHENVKAFISHCGISSLYESVYFGKPMILMPVFADQFGNAGILMSLGVGMYLDVDKITEAELLETLNEVIYGTTYRENMGKLSQTFKDEPISPSEKVLFWTEYVLRHNGTTHLKSKTVDMPIYRYLLLDIIGVLILAAVISWRLVYFWQKLFLIKK